MAVTPSSRTLGHHLRRAAGPVLATAGLIALVGCSGGGDGETLRVYSGRHYGIETAFEKFEEETGIEVEFLTGNDAELRERIAAEGEDTEADVYLTVDAGNLGRRRRGRAVPAARLARSSTRRSRPSYRDPEDRWFGLAVRTRTIVYNTDAIDEAEVPDDLRGARRAGVGGPDLPAQRQQRLPAVAGRQHDRRRRRGGDARGAARAGPPTPRSTPTTSSCSRRWPPGPATSASPTTTTWPAARGGPRLRRSSWCGPSRTAAACTSTSPAAASRKYADDPELAQQFLEWLATDGQDTLVADNHEYPANPTVAAEPLIAERSAPTSSATPCTPTSSGSLNPDAVRLMDEAGFG